MEISGTKEQVFPVLDKFKAGTIVYSTHTASAGEFKGVAVVDVVGVVGAVDLFARFDPAVTKDLLAVQYPGALEVKVVTTDPGFRHQHYSKKPKAKKVK